MNTPRIDLKELQRLKEENFRERLEFLEKYAQWIKKTSKQKRDRHQRVVEE